MASREHLAYKSPEAVAVGGLCVTSKMPCYSWSVSAYDCINGGKLRAIKGSICNKCYAHSGRATYPTSVASDKRRLAIFNANPIKWALNMVRAIDKLETSGYFRWFDRGDLQSVRMLEAICAVAENTPNVKHWLPTKEYGIVREYLATGATIPANLTIRLSAPMVDGWYPKATGQCGSIVLSPRGVARYENVATCQAYVKTNGTCGDCRMCWNREVKTVAYPLH